MQSFHVGFERAPSWFTDLMDSHKATDVSVGSAVSYTVSTRDYGIKKAIKGDIVWRSSCGAVGVQQNNPRYSY